MRARSLLIASLAAVAALAPPATAADAAKLQLTKVSKPQRTVVAGKDLFLSVRVDNAGARAGRAVLRMTLQDGAPPYGLPKRIGRIPTGMIDGGAFKRYLIRLTVPETTAAGRYRLRTCLNLPGKADQCRTSRRIQVKPAT